MRVLCILPVPWEVTVSSSAGTARAPEHIFKASMQVDLHDADFKELGAMDFSSGRPTKKSYLKVIISEKKQNYYIDYISKGELVENNAFMTKSLKEINEGGVYMNKWVYEQTKDLLNAGKLVGLLGGDHSTPLGYLKAIAEKHGEFGIFQIDAHCDLRKGYENFKYSHASIMYNALTEIDSIKKLVQIGIRDLGPEEMEYIIK